MLIRIISTKINSRSRRREIISLHFIKRVQKNMRTGQKVIEDQGHGYFWPKLKKKNKQDKLIN